MLETILEASPSEISTTEAESDASMISVQDDSGGGVVTDKETDSGT